MPEELLTSLKKGMKSGFLVLDQVLDRYVVNPFASIARRANDLGCACVVQVLPKGVVES